MRLLRSLGEVLGLASITAGATALEPWLGLVVGGVCLVLLANFGGSRSRTEEDVEHLAEALQKVRR